MPPRRQRYAAGTELRVGLPAEEPPGLRDLVAAWAHPRTDVVAVHHALVQGERDPDPLLVLGLELAPGADAAAAVDACVRDLAGFAAVAVTPDAAGPVVRFMRDRDDPLYRRR